MVALLWLIVLGIVLIGIWIFVVMMIRKWTTEIAVTNHRFVLKTGWISRKTEEIGLNRIEEVKLQQSVVGRILGYGRMTILTTNIGEIHVPAIEAPLELCRHITNAQDGMRPIKQSPESVTAARSFKRS